jgi:type II secretory pathway pseudopilin PulG
MVRIRAFSLIEMTVMLFIVALIGLISYSAVSSSSVESRSKLAHLAAARVLSAQQSFAAAHGRFTPDPTQLFGVGRDLTVSASASTWSDIVSLAVSAEDTLVLAVAGAEGTCFVLVVSSMAAAAELTESISTDTCLAASFLPGIETALPAEPV